jgi:adenylate cyclase
MKLRSIKTRLHEWRELRTYLLVIIAAYVLTLGFGSLLSPLRVNLQNLVFDQYQRWHPRPYNFDQPVRIVEIDDESIRRIGRWPWPRQTMASIVDALTKAKVAAVGFDVLFSEKDESDSSGDLAFAQAIADRPVVLGTYFTATSNAAKIRIPAKASFSFLGEPPGPFLNRFSGVLLPLPELTESAAGLGFMNWLPDADRVVRRVPLLLDVNGQVEPSLALETLRVAQGASGYLVKSTNAYGKASASGGFGVAAIKVGDIVIPTQPASDLRVWFAKDDLRRSIPAWKVLTPGADLSDLAGKIVLVGASAALLSDIVATPLNPSTPGVEAHAQLIEQILDGVTLLRPDWAPGAELVTGALLSLGLVAIAPLIPILWTALAGFAATSVMIYVSWIAFTRHGVLLDPVVPSVSSGFVFLAAVGQLYGQKRQQVHEIRSAFGRFVSPAVVARLAEHPENLQLGGRQRDLTLLFCDIRSFTTLSEGLSAVELTKFLNEYLTPMTNVVLKENGTIDKYMGDAIMAFWNAPLDDPEHGVHAVRAALEMRGTLAHLNNQWRQRAEQAGEEFRPVKFGIGLNTGECCVGNLGSTLRFDYSAIGDEVNVASRLEGSSKFFGVDIVASSATREEAREFAWLEIDKVQLKNKTRSVPVYALAGGVDYAASEEFKGLLARHEEILTAYRTRRFADAMRLAAEAAKFAPLDIHGLYYFYERRFSSLAELEIPDAWSPMIALDEK